MEKKLEVEASLEKEYKNKNQYKRRLEEYRNQEQSERHKKRILENMEMKYMEQQTKLEDDHKKYMRWLELFLYLDPLAKRKIFSMLGEGRVKKN